MNRGHWKPAISLVVLLVLSSAIGLLSRGNTSSAQSSTNAPVDEPPPKVADDPKAANPPRPAEPANNRVTAAPAAVVPQAGDNPKTATTPKVSAETGNATERRQLLETIGALIAAHCYQTYFNIGLLADGRAKGTYKDKDATKVLDSILSILGTVQKKLTALDKLALDVDDRASLAQMRELYGLLRRQADDLQSLWDNGREEDAARYENTRKDAWAAISKLLGVGR
jgi:hypothetical protein